MMKLETILTMLLFLFIGILIGMGLMLYFPVTITKTIFNCTINPNPNYVSLPIEKNAPSNYLNRSDIFYYERQDNETYETFLCINISNAQIVSYANTGSMKSTLDENTNGIVIPVDSPNQIHIGDIVTYEYKDWCNSSDYNSSICDELIAHRVINIVNDSSGFYYMVRGDANNAYDPVVKFNQIKHKVIGIIYLFSPLIRLI